MIYEYRGIPFKERKIQTECGDIPELLEIRGWEDKKE